MNPGLKAKLQSILGLETYANRMGFSTTCLLLARDIVLDERVTMHCHLNLCTNYGKNLMCPPFLPSVADNRQMIDRYTFALLLQLKQALDRYDKEFMRQTFDANARRFGQMAVALERKAFSDGFRLAMALGAGECKLCDNCVIQNGERNCVHPGTARPSMEGMGIDVVRTFAAAGLDLDFTTAQLTVAGILLID
ncbi:MAG: DUF2284 domain-containing protein [Syntrophomonadaceae bacterium]|nr:DUF2284 domain-containing protein [Syntrophomonadaceae bacterium]